MDSAAGAQGQLGRDRDDEIAGIPGVWAKYSTPSLINHLPKNHLTCSGSKPTASAARELLSPLLADRSLAYRA